MIICLRHISISDDIQIRWEFGEKNDRYRSDKKTHAPREREKKDKEEIVRMTSY